jgi:hypothetical protein
MDGFITPLVKYAQVPPDTEKVKTAYAVYVGKLDAAR